MRWTRTLIPTAREDPQEAEIPSHRLMLRAGLIRKLAGGLYTFLPLGLRALRKVERIVREEMDRSGALEILMPALQPREIWDRSGRYETMGDVMYKLKDRQGREMVMGPTHEEVVTDLVSREVRSYRDMPVTLYQIQAKFRDEIRPRFGLMRAREFIMKDAYSFDTGWDEADASYQAMYKAYERIFARCGLRTKVVEADTGAMGGKWSHEFMVLADSGEDGLVECESCSYAANLERAERQIAPVAPFENADRDKEDVPTPGASTIEQVSAFLGCPPHRLLKTMIYLADGKPAAVLVPGDRDVNENKLRRCLGAGAIALADAATIEKATSAPVGFAGPVGLTIPVYADAGLKGYAGAVTGANRADTHTRYVSLERDASVTAYHDICIVRGGDLCPRCGSHLREKRGIEVGHVFKLGTKYTESFTASYLDAEGKSRTIVMGCYGIGVTRVLQAVIEQMNDENGILWPLSVAPYSVVVVPLDVKPGAVMTVAGKLCADLEQAGLDVLLDDRDERPGVKFKDADLVGFPVRAVVSERSLAKNAVEVKMRSEHKPALVGTDDVVRHILEITGGGNA